MSRLLFILPLAAWPASALAEPNFPLPEFSTGYRLPQTTTPGPRAPVFAYVDLAMLVAALALAAYFALRLRSRRHMTVLVLFSLLYFGFYRRGCVCSVGAIQNVALSLLDNGYALPLVVGGFFVLPLVFALFFGRVFCAGACPLGAAQDLVLLRPVKVPKWLEDSLGLLPFVYLGVAALYAATNSRFLICEADPFVSFFRLAGPTWVVVFGVALLLLGVVVGRPYCRFLCPYSALLRMLAPFARWRLRLTHGDCVQCRLCAEACPFGAIQPATAAPAGLPRREGRRQLATFLLLLPTFVAAGALLGRESSAALARVNSRVSLAERVFQEQQGWVEGTTVASEAFYRLGRPNEELYREAVGIRRQFDIGAALLGAWLGLVIGLRFIGLTTWRRRDRSEIDPAACVACGRCLNVCPVERERAKGIPAEVAHRA
jgi:NosR/NirI family nitrous oxide reductase transcriptional regulator